MLTQHLLSMELANKGSHSSISYLIFLTEREQSSVFLMQTNYHVHGCDAEATQLFRFISCAQTTIINIEKMKAKLLSRDQVLHIEANH